MTTTYVVVLLLLLVLLLLMTTYEYKAISNGRKQNRDEFINISANHTYKFVCDYTSKT